MKKSCVIVLSALLFGAAPTFAQEETQTGTHQLEKLNHGLIAYSDGSNTYVTWRLLKAENPETVKYNLYSVAGRKQTVLAKQTAQTFLVTPSANQKNDVSYKLEVFDGTKLVATETYTLGKGNDKPYINIPLQPITVAEAGEMADKYTVNDGSAADVDGDGELELIVKREFRSHDNSHKGITDPVFLEAYKINGTMLWRVNLGVNIRAGAHYTQFIAYDFDNDGCAEIAVKTAPGTKFADGSVIKDKDGNVPDLVDRNPKSPTFGMIVTGEEFLSVISGKDGRELARTEFISRGEPGVFGDFTGNRQDRFLAALAFLDGKTPSFVMCRGYYTRTILRAYNYKEGKIEQLWEFDSFADHHKYADAEGQGNHNLSVADVDGDGFDEITYGSMMFDHDGTIGYNTHLGHGDAMHLTDIDIDRPGLELWDCHEHAPCKAGGELRDARTGELIWGIPTHEDVGRALAADIDPRFRGCECWIISSPGVYTADGRLISEIRPSINFAIWWTGDLNRELLNGSGVPKHEFIGITKWNGDGIDFLNLADAKDCKCNNYTKGNPILQADLFGDWREEFVVPTKDNKSMRLYLTTYPTEYRFTTLMHDPVYRCGIAWQNVAYNQPPHTGFYLGSDLGEFRPAYFIWGKDAGNGKSGVAEGGRPNGMHQRMKNITVAHRDTVDFRVRIDNSFKEQITLDAGCDYQKICWTVGDKVVGTERKLLVDRADIKDDFMTVKIRAEQHGCVWHGEIVVRK